MEKKTRLLKESTEELRKEVIQKRLEIKALREDMAQKQKQLVKELKEVEDLMEYQVGLKVRGRQSTDVRTSLCLRGQKTTGRRVAASRVTKRAATRAQRTLSSAT